MLNVTFPLPELLLPEVMVIHAALLTAVQAQPAAVETEIESVSSRYRRGVTQAEL